MGKRTHFYNQDQIQYIIELIHLHLNMNNMNTNEPNRNPPIFISHSCRGFDVRIYRSYGYNVLYVNDLVNYVSHHNPHVFDILQKFVNLSKLELKIVKRMA